MGIKARQFTDNVPALESLCETYVYQVADKIAKHIKPTRQEVAYITNEIRRQGISPTGLLLRGWLFDFSAIITKQEQLSIF